MNIAEFSIKKSVITYTLTVVLLVIGYYSYQGLPRLEDPEFAIKDAVIVTPYPGASPEDVEKEVGKRMAKEVLPTADMLSQWQLYNALTNIISHSIEQRLRARYQMAVSRVFQL